MVPKELLPFRRLPLIGWAVAECAAAGIEEVVIVSSPAKGDLAARLSPSRLRAAVEGLALDEEAAAALEQLMAAVAAVRLVSVLQERPAGLGDAVRRGWLRDEPVAVLLPDELYLPEGGPGPLLRLAAVGTAREARIALVDCPDPVERSAYGVARLHAPLERLPAGGTRLAGLVEKPAPGSAPSRFASVGRYLLPADLRTLLEVTAPGRGGEVQLADALDAFAPSGRLIGVEVDAAARRDVGEPARYAAAVAADGERYPQTRG
jgi:UTP--glucose-1-phosphate uridylyltransferase